MYRDVIRISIKCPKHTGFSPVRDGRGAVRGACPHCSALCDLAEAVGMFRRQLREASERVTDGR